jgi:acyl-CoA thioesterase-1
MKQINKAIARLLTLSVGVFLLIAYPTGLINHHQNFSASGVTSPSVATLPSTPKVVFFGSSTTAGVGATRGDRRWTTLLSRYLDWQEINSGLSGSTLAKPDRSATAPCVTPSGVERWEYDVVRHKPDLAIVLYGVNDAVRNIPLDKFQADLKTMLTGLRSHLQPEQILISTSQPNRDTQISRIPYDLALQAAASEAGVRFINAGKEAISPAELPNYSADGLHLNNLGHAKVASYMANKMVELGFAPPPPVTATIELGEKLQPLPGKELRIDLDHPLKFGEIQEIETKWVNSGQAVLSVVRPDGRGGYEVVYQTPRYTVEPGTMRVPVPRWWVLEGDLLGVWTSF